MTSVVHLLGPLKPEAAEPLYLQLQAALQRALRDGRLPADQALPSERALAAGLNISRVTVRRALDGLVQQGLLVRHRGAGTYPVADAPPQA